VSKKGPNLGSESNYVCFFFPTVLKKTHTHTQQNTQTHTYTHTHTHTHPHNKKREAGGKQNMSVAHAYVALIGGHNSGKDTVAEMLQNLPSYKLHKIRSIRDTLKDIAQILLPTLTRDQLYGKGECQQAKLQELGGHTVHELLMAIGRAAIAIEQTCPNLPRPLVTQSVLGTMQDSPVIFTDCLTSGDCAALINTGSPVCFVGVVRPRSDDAFVLANGDSQNTESHVLALIAQYADTAFLNDGNLDDLRMKVEKRFTLT
jgi:hypothetical protein